jgi:hypothetical protein
MSETAYWKIGDRVQRRVDVFDEKSRLLRGMVTSVKADEPHFVYYVQWDGEEPEPKHGYFWFGLSPEEPRRAALGGGKGI